MAVLRLCCCDGFFLFVTSRATLELWCADFSLRWLLLLQSMGSRMCGLSGSGSWGPELRLSSCGAWVSCSVHVGSSGTRNGSCVSCTDRWIL